MHGAGHARSLVNNCQDPAKPAEPLELSQVNYREANPQATQQIPRPKYALVPAAARSTMYTLLENREFE